MKITRAQLDDAHIFLKARQDAAAWLAQRGIDQWSSAWPDEDGMRTDIEKSISAGTAWIARINNELAATFVLDTWANPDLWTPDEAAEPAMYIHRLIVNREYAGRGIGARILDWCSETAAKHGARLLRLDAWTTNPALHEYYLNQGFTHVRTLALEHNPSGWLAQRPVSQR